LEDKLHNLSEIPELIAARKAQRLDLVERIFSAKTELLSEHKRLYGPVQRLVDRHPISQEHGGIEFSALMGVEGFIDGFLGMIHQGKRGSFQGEKEGRDLLKERIAASDFSTSNGIQEFLSWIENELAHTEDNRDQPRQLRSQLLHGIEPSDLYNFIYGLSYLKPRFELRWQSKPLSQLSPGERGSLLLLFFLLVDKRDVPLIIDQPEENLDNQTVATMVVPALKYAKERRQIIIVTHNPNLAVVCDADQVIYSSIDKGDGNRITYTSGSIENPRIAQLIVDVLEGTKPAFDLRDDRYAILEAPSLSSNRSP
jgi:predicted ATPase